ncbi:MAG: putative RNA methyltransferase [Acidimicrobiales bacterium]|jgi:23S rRNA (guanine745-N1)-methyltransferase
MASHEPGKLTAPWCCPVCRARLHLIVAEQRWVCAAEHSFDVAREGYVNLQLAGQRRSRRPGDSAEMVAARRRFLATGAFDPLSTALADLVTVERPTVVLDVGCGEGRHTRHVTAPLVLGVDVAKPAVAAAARADPDGWYAVASAADLPLEDGTVDVALNVFGPVAPAELARVVRHGGAVVAAYPGPSHLEDLRTLVYEDARPHEVKPPLRHAAEWFTEVSSVSVRYPIVVTDPARLDDLFAMTPYRWHAPADMRERLVAAASPSFETIADVRVTTYRRTARL